MTTEEKELLMVDLCARLPYGFKAHIINDGFYDIREPYDTNINIPNHHLLMDLYKDSGLIIQPYLRPMSSMTEEEKQELLKVTSLIEYDEYCETLKSFDFYGDARLDVGMEIWLKAFDWLNKKMFAYRTYNDKDMFELGLAIPAPAGMYK